MNVFFSIYTYGAPRVEGRGAQRAQRDDARGSGPAAGHSVEDAGSPGGHSCHRPSTALGTTDSGCLSVPGCACREESGLQVLWKEHGQIWLWDCSACPAPALISERKHGQLRIRTLEVRRGRSCWSSCPLNFVYPNLAFFPCPFSLDWGFFLFILRPCFPTAERQTKINAFSLWPYPQNGSAASTEVSWPGSPTQRGHEGPPASHATTSTLRHDAGATSTTPPPVWAPSI